MPSTAHDVNTSVIIPTFNRAQYLDLTLASFVRQTTRNFEIVIVDDGSTDDTGQVADRYRERLSIRYVRQANAGRSKARNTGIEHARGSLLVFCDDDRIVCPQFIAEHQDEHATGAPRVAIGWQHGIVSVWAPDLALGADKLGPLLSARPQLVAQLQRGPTPLVTPAMVYDDFDRTIADFAVGEPWQELITPIIEQYGCDLAGFRFPWSLGTTSNLSVSTSLTREVGMFDTEFSGWGLEDQELHYRLCAAGAATTVSRGAVNFHQVHARPPALMKQWNRNAIRLLEKHPSAEVCLFLRMNREKITIAEANRLAEEYAALAAAGFPAVAAEFVRVMKEHLLATAHAYL